MNWPPSCSEASMTAPQKFQTSSKNCLFCWTVVAGIFWKSSRILLALRQELVS